MNTSSTSSDLSSAKEQPSTFNFHDIHGNYAKRRYKNVESKVGRYIASIRAEERKRRAGKLIRRSSEPVNINNEKSLSGEDAENSGEAQHKGFSTNDLYKLEETTAIADYVGTEVLTTSVYASSSNGCGGGGGTSSNYRSSNAIYSSTSASTHESLVNGFVDKQTYAQLIYEKEHLEVLLDEKRGECLRHKRNAETLRIELANCEDELKRARTNSSALNLRYSTGGFVGYSFAARSNYSLETLCKPSLATKSIQTEDNYFIDENVAENLETPKRISNNENICRLRANSSSFKNQIENDCNRRSSRHLQVVVTTPSASHFTTENSSPTYTKISSCGRLYAAVPTKNDSTDSDLFIYASNQKSNRANELVKRHRQRATTFRQRLNRFFGRCTLCEDPNQSLEAYGDSNQENDIEMKPTQSAQS